MKILLFSDLDGSLLDHDTYGFDEARDTVAALQAGGVAIIINSSKTDAEIRGYVSALGLSEPFICEGGGLLFCPAGLFPYAPEASWQEGGYQVHLLGRGVEELRTAFFAMREAVGLPLRALFEMDDRELRQLTGLPGEKIPLMRLRRASVPFISGGEGEAGELPAVREWIEAHGFRYAVGGRFHHLTGPSDKGTAAARLAEMYRQAFSGVLTVAVGDGLNDLPLLRWADHAIAIPSKRGLLPQLAGVPRVRLAPAPGPAGWRTAVGDLFHELKVPLSDACPSKMRGAHG